MLLRRLVTAVAVIATTLALVLGLSAGSASAQPRHHINAQITRVTNHRFVVHGHVTLTKTRFQVLKRRAHFGRYVPLERPGADNRGHFRFTVTGDPGDCFLMRLPATSRHRATEVSLGCIHRTR